MPRVRAIYAEANQSGCQTSPCVKRGWGSATFQAWQFCGRAGYGCRKGRRSGLNSIPLVAGPTSIQTLRGKLCGREVALILCGEAHEDAIDLTRSKSILEPKFGWVAADAFVGRPIHSRSHVTLQVAKKWAARAMTGNEAGGLLFQLDLAQGDKGTAHVFHSDHIKALPGNCQENGQYFLWKDLDSEARLLQDKKASGQKFSVEELHAILAKRKQRLRTEEIELFDDWLIRVGNLQRVELILEGPVLASEVELHSDPVVDPAPVADETLQLMEPDSGEEEAEDSVQELKRVRPRLVDDGNGSFLEYVRRRVRQHVPRHRIHFFDLRDLGDPDELEQKREFQQLLPKSSPVDLEERRAQELCLPARLEEAKVVPSWEAFFGAASELLYYSPHIHADYVPFLARVMKAPELPPQEWLLKFFQHLYCGLMSDALAMLRLEDPNAAKFLRLRSLLHWNGRKWRRRQDVRPLIPVLVAPLGCYLKAKGFPEPRTWISGVAERLRRDPKASDLVAAAQKWYLEEVERFLQDVKKNDLDGDHFNAYLREVHREIYDDIDPNRHNWMHAPSVSRPYGEKFYDLGKIQIPSFEEAMREILSFDPLAGKASTPRQRVLAKIIVDVFQLRMVDLASVLLVLDRALAYPEGSEVVLIMYAGSDHSQTVEKFYRNLGFSADFLPRRGLVGKDQYGPREPRGLKLPSYLYQFSELFQGP